MFISLRKGHISEHFLQTNEHYSTALQFTTLFLFTRVTEKKNNPVLFWRSGVIWHRKNRRWASIQTCPAIKILSYWLHIDIRKSIKCCCGQYVFDIVQVHSTLAKHPNKQKCPAKLQKSPPATRAGQSQILICQHRLLTVVMESHHQEKPLSKGRWNLLKSRKRTPYKYGLHHA